MSDKIINIYEAIELYEQELETVTGGKDVPIKHSDLPPNIKFVAESSTDSFMQSMNRLTSAFHLITLKI